MIEHDIDISIVIPAYKSEKFLEKTIAELTKEIEKSKLTYEILIIVDGCEDNTWDVALMLSKKHQLLRSVQLLKNYGQHTANLCGFRHAKGRYVITMDDDGQNPPSELVKFEKFYGSEYDLVIGKHISKKHNFIRRIGSKVIGALNRNIFEIKSSLILSNYRMVRRDVVDRIISYKSPNPYVPGLCLKNSNNQINIDITHRERFEGDSNYSLISLISLVFELLIQHSYIPLKLLALVGALMASLGMLGAVYVIYSWFVGANIEVQGWRSVITILLISSGAIMSGISILGLYVIRVIENQSSTQFIESNRSW